MLLLSACHRDVTTNNNKINRKSNKNTLSPVTIQFVIQFHSPTTANLKKNKSFRTYDTVSCHNGATREQKQAALIMTRRSWRWPAPVVLKPVFYRGTRPHA